MRCESFHKLVIVSCVALLCSSIVVPATPAEAEEVEILKITVGKPTKLSSQVYQNTSALLASRTGVVAVIYPKAGGGPRFYRISTDGGVTWSKEMASPDAFGGGQNSGTLFPGGPTGAIIPATDAWPSTNYTRAKGWTGEADPSKNPEGLIEGRYDILFLRFPDDMLSWTTERARIYVPNHILGLGHVPGPGFTKGKIMQMPDGSLLSPMHGCFEGDDSNRLRAYLVRSTDQGRTWRYYATSDYSPKDPNPELPGHYVGAAEPSFVLLPNGQMLAMLRKQYAHYPGEYKPLYVSWSNDVGRTWTKPIPTKPHLMCISPTLQVLDNGVVACEYGRPGFHVAFSLDNGRTWQDRVSFSDLPEPIITGQFDMIKAGPNKLLAVGSVDGGTKVWPITVQRIKVSQTHALLEGRVLDQQGKPIAGAKVERGPNRYALDTWLEHATKLDEWKAAPLTVGSPKLAYRSIQEQHGHPTVQTDAQGRFHFENVKLGEYVLTVEAKGYAPQHKHVKIGPESKPQDFQLKLGRKICNRVVDNTGGAVPGACVVLNLWHVHTDLEGFFHWSVEAPLPKQVDIRVHKRWIGDYEALKTTVPFSQLESQPITLKNR